MSMRHAAANSKLARPPWLRYLIKHRLGLLLALEVFAVFGIAPLTELGMLPHILLGATFTLILLVGVLMLDLRSRNGRLLALLGLALLPVQLWRYARPNELVLVLHPLGLICFLLIISGALANDVFRSKRIKIDQVLGGVVLYLNIGLTFAVAYTLVEHVSPGAFVLPQPVPRLPLHPTYFAYFSFVTLTTVGYGDTVPVEAVARSLATLEAALGQLYPAIILARLVSIEVSQRDQQARSKDRQEVAQNAGRAARDL
jgi:voltage-gated potassium channel Kch